MGGVALAAQEFQILGRTRDKYATGRHTEEGSGFGRFEKELLRIDMHASLACARNGILAAKKDTLADESKKQLLALLKCFSVFCKPSAGVGNGRPREKNPGASISRERRQPGKCMTAKNDGGKK
ncbi:hypothetical protein D7024_05270 [Desulfofundulus salinus]|uniref:Uncharacterized protein n=1 Tax=Desulfofundulus salinus TaxID=2419843 RepID=A0A494WVZ8_9FIRM|nr:hypothetical protein D7024_05270 [Desulfofundulus salinum]